jgi:hypothetical protein
MAEYDINALLSNTPVEQQGMDVNELLRNAQTPAQPQLAWRDVPMTAARNLPSSAYKMGTELVHAVTNPLETAGNVMDLGAGLLRSVTPDFISKRIDQLDWNPEAAKRGSNAADQLAAMYKEKYGTSQGFKQALAYDPASVIADAATLISPMSGGFKKLGEKTGFQPTAAVGRGTADILGATTGVGGETVQRAFKAGTEGDQAFWKNLRGQVPMQDVLDSAKQNLQNLRIEKNKDYRSGMVDIRSDKSLLDFKGLDDALTEAEKLATFKGQVKNKKGYDVYQEIKDEVSKWKKLDPAEYHTPEGFDALKQKLGGIIESIPPNEKTANMIGKQIYNKAKSTINDQAPTYAGVMKDYGEASDLIREIERSLSLGEKASADTAMRKLQSLTRNNVNTNYGNRLELAKQLEQGGTPLLSSLAGQSMSATMPRGLAGIGGLGTIGASVFANPYSALALPFQSPLAVGAGAYGAGKAVNMMRKSPIGAGQGIALSNMLPQINNAYKVDLTGMANKE